ncbi:MAG: methylenetetrahydrofolate--tRNA-(uracil(54)-C(5))-methyltransferase (FADH(2)-oxidizing) TrmFO [Deltaproteobacteria bacterium]|nr:methylenetetrahydrofolate--tRNA-(uracil(54)-C(5))-methyltransferase (FADH(2)-oxidizing) TrmFO [Deltaproteobacteria bacterium]
MAVDDASASDVTIIGGGLAGCEACWRALANGLKVTLWEMKPKKFSPAHINPNLAELVCSNSFRADDPKNAVGLLKEELRLLGSLVMSVADLTKVPAGRALAVDREEFSRLVTEKLTAAPNLTIIREEFTPPFPFEQIIVVAAGPLASDGLTNELKRLAGSENLHFYDALAPIVAFESLNLQKIFAADRYGEPGQGDYLNCPLTKDEFMVFYDALTQADRTSPRPFENMKFFEGCLPIEVMAARGEKTLTFGPMKPVGLTDPRTGRKPYAVVQLRRENPQASSWNMVGFQTRLTRASQDKVFRLIPGLENAEFSRYGAIHRNTYLQAPQVLDQYQRLKLFPTIFLAGQISGVEGYVESAAQGLWAGENASRMALGKRPLEPPRDTALGSLLSHLKGYGPPSSFAPSNVNFGLFPSPPPAIHKRDHSSWRLAQARDAWPSFLEEIGYERH